jgi:signal transduction histidine kinase
MRVRWTWILFGLGLLIVLGLMSLVSVAALRLDRAECRARIKAAQEESVRLALWRMDSALSPLLSRESSRPYFTYSAFYVAERAYTKMFAEISVGEVVVPSPILILDSSYVLLHFQVDDQSHLTSPQVPMGNMRDLAEYRYNAYDNIIESEKLLAGLNPEKIIAAFKTRSASRETTLSPSTANVIKRWDEQQARMINQQRLVQQSMQQGGEYNQPSGGIESGDAILHPLWIDEQLLLTRRIAANKRRYIQGCMLNWPAIRKYLLSVCDDILPDAQLEPIHASPGDRYSMLASLPVRVIAGETPILTSRPFSPIHLALIIAWIGLLTCAAAFAWLLARAIALSERRGAFVSAVTHELRTPLTTLRMYTEMLAEGMVPEEKRSEYLNTLCAEANRLGHLIENVLAYSRLERGRHGREMETVELGELLRRVSDRLSQRALQAEMQLNVNVSHRDLQVRADVSAVERILFNLVDNACKYAANGSDKILNLDARQQNGEAHICVRDHGPGIAVGEEKKLFAAFTKSASDAASTAPGIGLGLALSQRLARCMNGNLALDHSVDKGACFVLTLPLADSSQ